MEKEVRFLGNIEVRADEESRTITGYAALFNTLSDPLGGFREKIAPGAFDNVLKDDVRALVNHDSNLILARSPKTLKLSIDERGLKYEFEAPKTSAGNDILESVKRGDINQSSFAFSVNEDEWKEDDEQRVIREIKSFKRLYDVSPVTFPAYPDTTVAKRSLDAFNESKEDKIPEYYFEEIERKRKIAAL